MTHQQSQTRFLSAQRHNAVVLHVLVTPKGQGALVEAQGTLLPNTLGGGACTNVDDGRATYVREAEGEDMAQQPFTTPTGVLETPYLRAQQVWDDRMGSARVQATHWRRLALSCVLANLVLGGGLVYQSLKAQGIPYIVEGDSQGEVRTVGPAAGLSRPSQAAIQPQGREFVRTMRGLATDPIVVRERWMQVYAGVTPRGAPLLQSYARERDPFGKVGKVSIAVDVQRVLPLTETSDDVQWNETIYDTNGVKTEEAKDSGRFAVLRHQPKTAQALKANPLGLYIDTFSWSRKDQ